MRPPVVGVELVDAHYRDRKSNSLLGINHSEVRDLSLQEGRILDLRKFSAQLPVQCLLQDDLFLELLNLKSRMIEGMRE